MTKKIFEKILSRTGVLTKNDLTADEKASLYALMESLGSSQSTTYLRFFSKGYDLWEISGVAKIKSDYLDSVKDKLIPNQSEDAYSAPGKFYATLKDAGLVLDFKTYMQERGMSQNTTWTRFSEDNWKPWELRGVASVIEEYCKEKS